MVGHLDADALYVSADRDFFLLTAMHWATDATGSGARSATAAVLAREAAVCHLLFRAGKHAAVLARLRAVCEKVLEVRFSDPSPRSEPGAAETLAAAADLFHRLRLAVEVGDRAA